jgi:hypothetical protein
VVVGESRYPVLQLPIGAESLNSHTLGEINVLAFYDLPLAISNV